MEKPRVPHNGDTVRRPPLRNRQMAAFRSMIELPLHERREVLDLVVLYELAERDEPKAIKRSLDGDVH